MTSETICYLLFVDYFLNKHGLVAAKTFFLSFGNIGSLLIAGNRSLDLCNWIKCSLRQSPAFISETLRIEMQGGKALCRPDISAYNCEMAPFCEVSLNSLYILCVPVRESYLNHTPKFFTVFGFRSNISLTARISPTDFLALLSFLIKYQNLDFARTLFFANKRIR